MCILKCPSCQTTLTLFTPREATLHINTCLDRPATPLNCAVCKRDLSGLTIAAREEHANRCADTLLPLVRPAVRESGARETTARASAAPAQTKAELGDERVGNLLRLLGLERYADRFAAEEIDMDALRLLKEEDLVSLRIPEAARRRIAEALHSVPILHELERRDEDVTNKKENEDGGGVGVVPTQKFVKSRLGGRAVGGGFQLDDGSEDGHCSQNSEEEDVCSDILRVEGRRLQLEEMSNEEVQRDAKEKASGEVSSGCDETTGIDGAKRWRLRRVQAEERRHEREMKRIERAYEEMVGRMRTGGMEREKEEEDGEVEQERKVLAVYDLTQEVSEGGEGCGIVLSSRENTPAGRKERTESESEAEEMKMLNSNRYGFCTPKRVVTDGDEAAVSQDEDEDSEIMNLISAEKSVKRKKRGREKASRADILDAIRRDESLLESILAMESVGLERVLKTARGADGKCVSKKILCDLLHAEGVMYKGEAAKAGTSASQYMHRMNTDVYYGK